MNVQTKVVSGLESSIFEDRMTTILSNIYNNPDVVDYFIDYRTDVVKDKIKYSAIITVYYDKPYIVAYGNNE